MGVRVSVHLLELPIPITTLSCYHVLGFFYPDPLFFFSPYQLSFDLSEYTANVDGVGTLRLLDAIRTCGLESQVKFYQVGVLPVCFPPHCKHCS